MVQQAGVEVEKLCRKCGEYWPADLEFFYRQTSRPGGLSSNCKACLLETQAYKRRRGGGVVTSPWEQLFTGQEVAHG